MGRGSGRRAILARIASRSAVVPARPRVREAMSRRMARLAGSPIFRGGALDVEVGLELLAAGIVFDDDVEAAAEAGGVIGLEDAPAAGDGSEVEALAGGRRGDDAGGRNIAGGDGEAGVIEDRGDEETVSPARGVSGEKARRMPLALGEMALVSLQRMNLAPEAVVVFILQRRGASAMRHRCP